MFQRIRAVRDRVKLSQEAFGEKLGVSRDVINNLESNRTEAKSVFLHHMCKVYGVNLGWLETGEGNMFDQDPDALMRLDHAQYLFKTLRPEFQDFALEMIRGLTKLDTK